MSQTPEAGKPYITVINDEEVTFILGERIGKKSASAMVWSIESFSGNVSLPGCAKANSCVIKIYTSAGDVTRITKCSKLLEKIGILQPETMLALPDAPLPFIIQERLIPGENLLMFSSMAEFIGGSLREVLGNEVVNTFADLRDAGLGWSDAKLDNVYWKKVDGKWKLGTFDPDLVAPWAERASDIGMQFNYIEANPNHLEKCRKSLSNRIERIREIVNESWAQWKFGTAFKEVPQRLRNKFNATLTDTETWAQDTFGKSYDEVLQDPKILKEKGGRAGIEREFKLYVDEGDKLKWSYFKAKENLGPYTASPEHFGEMIFEDRGWIQCCDPDGNFIDGALTVEQIRTRFPKFGKRDRMAPTDPSVPFAKTETVGLP